MNVRESVKPAVWGAIGGAVVSMVIGFNWGGWVTGGTAAKMETAGAEAAIVQAFTPLCVARGLEQPDMVLAMKEESTWKHDDYVVEAGWVDNVSDKYQVTVARACAATLVEGLKAE